MSNRNISERQLVNRFLNNREATTPEVRDEYGKMWKRYLDRRVGLSMPVRIAAYRCGYLKNRGKAVGLFLENSELLKNEYNGEQKLHYSVEQKRRSLIDSFQYPATQTDEFPYHWEKIPRNAIIPGVAKILQESALPTPKGHLEQYVETTMREIHRTY